METELRKSRKRLASLTASLVLAGVVGGMFLAGVAVAADDDPWAFFPGTWQADEAMRFDPFTLITRPAGRAARTPTPAGAVAPSSDTGGSGSIEETDTSGSGGAGTPSVGYVPPPRIPYRPPLRSPFRPPI